ncbi:MAG TPA: BTAD domain-containing putative transcriptional regulator [Dermatophilaceae bacterium]|nr:BTAD domain-containing putative transcriptional regulator [Dermatophilaceae bacterium]
MADPALHRTSLRFEVLGPLQVLLEGRPAALGGPRQRAVLAILLINANRVIQLDRLVDSVWEGNPTEGSSTTLQTYVHHLRQALEPGRPRGASPEVLVTRDHGYLLTVNRSELDAAHFEDLVSIGRAALRDGRYEEAAVQLKLALALWRGPVLADLADYDFARTEAARLDELHLMAIETWVAAEFGLGHHEMLIAQLNQLVAAYPLREGLQAQRMLALYRSGRQAEALTAYQQVRTQLADELGIDAGEPLAQLHQQMLNHDPALEWQPRPEALAPGPPPTSEAGGGGSSALTGLAPTPSVERSSVLRRRMVLVRTASVVVAVLLVVLGVMLPQRTQNARAISGDSVGVLGPDGGGAGAVVPVGEGPDGVAYGADAIWVANTNDDTVSRIDLRQDRVVETIPVGTAPGAIAVHGNDIWVANSTGGTVSRINADTNAVVETVRVGNQPAAVAVGPSGLWVANAGDGTINRIDLSSGEVSPPVDVGDGPDGVAVGPDAVWVANGRDGTLMRVDPATGIVVKEIHVGAGPSGIALTQGSVWVANSFSQSVSRIDDSSNQVTATVPVGDGPRAMATRDNEVWVANEFDATVVRIAAGTGQVIRRLSLDGSPRALTSSDRGVWVSSRALAEASHRGGTLTVDDTEPLGTVDVDPAQSYNSADMVYDHLVGYRATGGAAGLVLVPDLATDLPQPTNGGKTYTFALRSGIRYSTGEVIRPEDIRRGVEREFTTGGGDPSYFQGILGAAACLPSVRSLDAEPHPPVRCDLSRGVLVDDATSTITFRLAQPDPDFLFKLTLFVVPTPAGSPSILSESPVIPGTGPYMPGNYTKGGPFTLVRNPYFRQWSYAAQPAGYPDVIRWLHTDRTTAVSQVAAGEADIVTLGGTQPDPLGNLALQFPSRVHTGPGEQTLLEFLNTQRPPFNNRQARSAVSYAIDRARLVELMGGSRHASPTCQLVPPNFPGYQLYCRYTINPRPGEGWQGRDLQKARELVRRSGTAGVPIEVWGPHLVFWTPINNYFVSLLKEIGYRHVRLHEPPDESSYIDALHDPHVPIQVGSWGWIADYPIASTFFGWAACDTSRVGGNEAGYCDPRLDSLVEAAKKVQILEPARAGHLWAEADRLFSDGAAYVPTVSLLHTAFVSARVGNFQDNPHTGPVLDQMWVR